MTRVFVFTNHNGGVRKSTSATNTALGIAGMLRHRLRIYLFVLPNPLSHATKAFYSQPATHPLHTAHTTSTHLRSIVETNRRLSDRGVSNMNTKRIFIIMLALAAVFALGLSAVSAQNGPGNGTGNGSGQGNGYQGGRNADAPRGNNNGGGLYLNLPPASTDELSQDIIDLIIDGWIDEQHAYAVYGSVIDKFGAVRPFVNIQRSEAQHIAAWEMMFVRYGIAMPEVPVFDLPEFTSLSEACAVGAEAEVANFDLYDTMLAAFEPYPDLLYVAQALRDASEFNHLPAFEVCAGR